MLKRMLKRQSAVWGIMLILGLLLCLTANALAAEDKPETLTIKGDGVSQELTFTRAELMAMSEGISQNIYSVTNNFPTNKLMYRKGISLTHLLAQAGLKENAAQFKFISADGYSRVFTRTELIEAEHFCFKTDGSAVKVPVCVAFLDSSKDFASLSPIELVLTMGQRIPGEQNNPWFVKYLETIEVSTAEPEQWSPVTFNRLVGPDRVSVELKHNNFDALKIYYTTDRTTPTINSKLYNVSASYYQPDLNKPILITRDTEIRAIAVGAGKSDSPVAATTVTFGGAVYRDLGDYPWAQISIEELSKKGIINGMGDYRFAPGELLTRAQFAKIIVLALGDKPKADAISPFSDVKSNDWHSSYVARAAELGLLKGYPDGTFHPDQALSRQEMLAIVVPSLGGQPPAENETANSTTVFTAESRISDWAEAYVMQAEKSGLLEHGHLVKETKAGLFFDAPGETTRAEAAETVYRLLLHI